MTMICKYFLIIIATILIEVLSQPSPFGFNVQFVGKNRYVSVEEENSRSFCTSIECLRDADILFTRSSQYEASDPCVDFANFSLATAMDVGPPSERDRERSFMRGIHDKLMDRLRRVFSDKIVDSDQNVVKGLKTIYKNLTKSDHALRHIQGHKAFVEYASFLGGSPYISHHLAWNPYMFDKANDFGFSMPKNSSALEMNLWNEKNFEYQKIIEHEPEHFLKFLFDLQLKRCKIPRKNSFKFDEILCFDTYNYVTGFTIVATAYKATFENTKIIYRMLELMNDNYVAGLHGKVELKEKMFDPAMKHFETFLKSRREILDKFKESKPEVIKIRDLRKISNDFGIDWLKLINLQLFEKYHVTEDDEILVKDLRMLKALIENLAKMPKEIAADFFMISFACENSGMFEFHQDDELRKKWTGGKKAVQRWELLVERAYMYMPTTLLLMYDQTYGDWKIKKSAEKFVREALQEAKNKFIRSTNLPLSISYKILSKLKRAKVICGFDHRLMKNLTLDEFNKELPQPNPSILPNGLNRTFNYAEMKLFGRKIMTTPKDDERRLITMQSSYDWFELTKLVVDYKYNMEGENILFFPSKTLIYPFYHPNRPRFFNMATLFTRAIFSIQQGIKTYVKENFNLTNYITGLENPIEVAYESYSKWLDTNEDLQLGANLLTNRQLFWIARSVVEYRKLHRQLPLFMKIMGKYLNEYTFKHDFQQSPGFLEAFKCNSTGRIIRHTLGNHEQLNQLKYFGFDAKDLQKIFEGYKFLG